MQRIGATLIVQCMTVTHSHLFEMSIIRTLSRGIQMRYLSMQGRTQDFGKYPTRNCAPLLILLVKFRHSWGRAYDFLPKYATAFKCPAVCQIVIL